MGGNIGVLALGVGMEVVVGIFLLVFWFAIFVLIAGLAFLIDFLLFEFTFLMFICCFMVCANLVVLQFFSL
jgi:hypothetical protein